MNSQSSIANSQSEQLRARVAMGPAGENLRAGSVIDFMVMPAGQHTCNFGQGNRVAKRTVMVEESAARSLGEQLAAVNAARGGKQRAFFDFDHKDEGPASAWPTEFYWRPDGVYCRAELSQAGAEAISGKNYRAFSPVFYVTKSVPATVICRQDADLCMGSLVNEPAFHEIEPLWAGERKEDGGRRAEDGGRRTEDGGRRAEDGKIISAAGGAAAVTDNNQPLEAAQQKDNKMTEGNKTAVAAENAAADNTDALKAKDTKIISLESENAALKAGEAKRRKADAEAAVAAAVRRGVIPAQNEQLKAKWQKSCEENPESIDMLNGIAGNEALQAGRLTSLPDAQKLEAKEGPKRTMLAYAKLGAEQAALRGSDSFTIKRRSELAAEMGALFLRDISKNRDVLDMPLTATDYSDPTYTLGTLSGTLVAQRTLELFKYNFPVLSAITTDFSDMPAAYNQDILTRIVTPPTVVTYASETLGWVPTASEPVTTDVKVTLDVHAGVPIRINANILASTVRRIFEEMAPAASYSLGKYFVDKIYALCTAAKFNGYAAVKAGKVPTAYASYVVALGDFARSHLAKIAATLNQNEVPIHDRVCLLNSAFFNQLATDPSLVTFFAGQQSPEIITENRLPKLATFNPIEAPNFPAALNVVGIALQKAGLVAVTRTSNDYTQALPGASYGNVNTITNPDTGMSVTLVQYVDHRYGFAEWRIQVMLGAAVGDKRGGLVITSA